MSALETPRFQLPLLAVGQAHKELYHNDALILLDFLSHPVVHAIANDPQSLVPELGDCWLIGLDAVAEWEGRSNQIAGWSSAGWHFINPQESMRIIVASDQVAATYSAGFWASAASIEEPAGGMTIDSQARAAIDSILETLRTMKILPQIN